MGMVKNWKIWEYINLPWMLSCSSVIQLGINLIAEGKLDPPIQEVVLKNGLGYLKIFALNLSSLNQP